MSIFKKIWQPLIRHRSVLLGAILISVAWLTLFFFLRNEHQGAERAAIQNSTNLAAALEEHLSRSLSEIDRSLKIIRTLYARDRNKFGQVTLDSAGADHSAFDLRDNDYFHAHVNLKNDELIVGRPVSDPVFGNWSLNFSRRIENRDGSFNGVIVATLDPAYLTRIYNSVNIGDDGYVRVIGLDGIVRATSGRTQAVLGKDFSQSDLFRSMSATSNGWFYTNSHLSDRVRRLIAYRSVNDYPFVISVSLAAHEIFAPLEALRRSGYLVVTILSLLILFVTGLSVRGQISREGAKKRVERANMLLNATLANMPHGICMFGADKKLVLANDLYSTMYGLNPEDVNPGTTLPQILEARVAAGCCPKDKQKYISDRVTEAFQPEPGYIVNELQDGRTFAVSRRAMPDGGSVAVHQDITAHLHAERERCKYAQVCTRKSCV
jgi:PAS domain-containing protein